MNNTRRNAQIFTLAVVLVCVGLLRPRESSPPPPARSGVNTSALLAAPGPSDFSRAVRPVDFEFPRDHGAHETFRTEWWYFTGHLESAQAREFGFQLTLFRFETDMRRGASDSAWRTPRIMLGHFALSDFENGRFRAFERLTRALPGIAGIAAEPAGVWLDDWRIEHVAGGTGRDWRLHAAQEDVRLILDLEAVSAVVAQGENGLSQKSSRAGNASYYYSIPRLDAVGQLDIDGETMQVTGQAWLDREWSTSALDPAQQGWDWFALQFDDGSNLMFYRLRRIDGGDDPYSAGSFVDRADRVTALAAGDVEITVEKYWPSRATGSRYPARWRLDIARLGLSVTLEPRLAGQEWTERFRYWEGAVTVRGTLPGSRLTGRGYVELTGY